MNFAVSNIGLTAFLHDKELGQLSELGITGVEVAPSRVWKNTWDELKSSDVKKYRKTIESAGLRVIGLHSLFYDQPELGLFKSSKIRTKSLQFLSHLSAVCRDLGGKTLIYGGGRKRGEISENDAITETINFFGELTSKTENHLTCFCIEPLGPKTSDFINSALDSLAIVNAVNNPGLRIQLDAKALFENNEANIDIFNAVKEKLVHFHANEPGLEVLGTSGFVNHMMMGKMLRAINYSNFISIEQRLLNYSDPLKDIATSAKVLKKCYVG